MAVKVGDKTIGGGVGAFVIAEMAWGHDGSLDKAMTIVDGAADAGADAVCIHVTSLPDYMVEHYGSGEGRVSAGHEDQEVYRYLESINLREEDVAALFRRAKERGLAVAPMCNDLPSVEFVRGLGPDAYVLPAAAFCEDAFVRAVAREGRPVFLRIGGALLGEIEAVVRTMAEEGNDSAVIIDGFQSYPTELKDMNLRYMKTLKKVFGVPVGFADHADGDSEMALVVPLLAVACGADVIEKHLTHDRSLKGEDFESALNPDEFAVLVTRIRETEVMLAGTAHAHALSEAEAKYRAVCRKRAVAARDIAPGERIGPGDIVYKRCDVGVYPDEADRVLGRTAREAMATGEAVTPERVE